MLVRGVADHPAAVAGDILYLDPPYARTSAYETALRPLDAMLEGWFVRTEPGRFSRTEGAQTLEQLLERSSGSGRSSRRRRFDTHISRA
jgi:hypothetical protein